MQASPSIEELNQRFAIAGVAQITAGNGGLPRVSVSTPAATAEIYLHGAQLTSWRPAGGEEVIFLSGQSQFEPGRAIRGGIPVCFPWFRNKADDPKAPSHGFVRTKAWQLDSITRDGDAVTISLSTASDEATRAWWPHDFLLVHRVTVGAQLVQELTVSNTGTTPCALKRLCTPTTVWVGPRRFASRDWTAWPTWTTPTATARSGRRATLFSPRPPIAPT